MGRLAVQGLAAALVVLSTAIGVRTQQPFFPIGVWYGNGPARAAVAPEPAGERDARLRELQTIRSLGFNHIRTRVEWAAAEPRRGAYQLDALEQMLSLADRAGLRVIVQIDSDSAPGWVGDAYPDAGFVTGQGVRIGDEAAPGFCLDHQRVRADVARFIGAVSRAARRHASLYAVDVWSDPHIADPAWFDARVELCYCPHTLARFRGWLQRKHGSLDALNRAWGRTFPSWERVEPPRGGAMFSTAAFIDWKTFIAAKLEEDLRMKAEAAKEDALPGGHRVSSHAGAPAVLLSPLSGFGTPDDWWMAGAVDVYGTSIYPKPAPDALPWSAARLMSGLDGIRSAARDRGWWVGELQAGPGAAVVRGAARVTAADLRLWTWAAISRGAQAVSYSAWYSTNTGRGFTSDGMAGSDGRITDRARTAGALAGLVDRNANLFTALRPERATVAIVYSRLTHMAGGDPAGRGQIASTALAGAYRAFHERNIQVDFVHPDEIVAGALAAYKAVYFPYPIAMAAPVAAALREYVLGGGTLIAEARPAWTDERGAASARVPGAGLDRVFGARERSVLTGEPMSLLVTSGDVPELRPLHGRAVPGAGYLELLELQGARALAALRSGQPVASINVYGDGRAILIGSFVSAAFEQDPVAHAAAGALIATLAATAGAAPRVAIAGGVNGAIEARLMESDRAMLLVAINHDDAPRTARIELPADAPAGEWQNLETAGSLPLAGRLAAGPAFEHRFAPRDVLVLLARKPYRDP